jgi:hypothetical protein
MEHPSGLSNRPERRQKSSALVQRCCTLDFFFAGKAPKTQANRLTSGFGIMTYSQQDV